MVRRFIALGAALLVMMAAAVSCNNPSDGESDRDKLRQAEDGQTGSDPRLLSDAGVVGVQYVRTGDYSGSTEKFVVVSSKAELEEYDRSIPDYIFSADGVGSNGFTENIAKYTDEFFEDNFLVIVRQVEPSGSISHSVQGVDGDGNIAVSRLVPEIGTCDIASWRIIIELDNDSKLDKYNVEFIDAVPIAIPTPVPIVPSPYDPIPAQTLKGTKWKLAGIQGDTLQVLQPVDCERCYTLVFDTDSTFTGRATINQFSGVYKADYANHNMKFEVILMTEAYDGSPDNLLFEKIVGKVSTGSVPVTFREGELIKLYDGNNPEYLVFRQL